MPINPILNGAANLGTNQVTVNATVTPIVTPRSTRRGVIIQNTGSTQVYLGGPSVSTTLGYPLPGTAGASVYIPTTAAIFGIVSSGSQAVAWLEIFD